MTNIRAATAVGDAAVPRPLAWGVSRFLIPPATAVAIAAAALLLLMTPFWVHSALDFSGGARALPVRALSHAVSDQTVAELFTGPGTFAAFGADEAGHMRDVRVILLGFLAIALASAAFVGWALWRHSRDPRTWRQIARGGLLLVGFVVVVGVFAALAFGVAFDLFHRLVFPGGNWAFAADSLLIRLYPYEFWQLSAAAFSVLTLAGGGLVWVVARRRARSLETRHTSGRS